MTTAAQMASYIYPEEEDPEGAFSWWLSPCGGTDLVPDEIKKVFEVASQVVDGVSSFKKPKNLPKGSGRRGDEGNPTDRSKPRNPSSGSGGGSGGGSGSTKPKCNVPLAKKTQRMGGGKNTVRLMDCVRDVTKTTEMVITSIIYAPNAQATQIGKPCSKQWSQACYHYSSAISASSCLGDADMRSRSGHNLQGARKSGSGNEHVVQGTQRQWMDG